MELKDKDIMKSLNEFVLYCKGWYKNSGDMLTDVVSLLKPVYPFVTKREVTDIIINRWNEWNEKLPLNEKLTVVKFFNEINKQRELLIMLNKAPKDFKELSLIVIFSHIRYIDSKYLKIDPPTYKKGKIRCNNDKQGMSYLEMNYAAKKCF